MGARQSDKWQGAASSGYHLKLPQGVQVYITSRDEMEVIMTMVPTERAPFSSFDCSARGRLEECGMGR